jgi:hypothetical protein
MITIQEVSQPSFIEYATAAIAAISAVVIAYQAIKTRDAVRASEATVSVAEASLQESRLARLESQVPRIFVFAPTKVLVSEVHERPQLRGHEGPVAVGRRWALPGDKKVILFSIFTFEVRNDGPGSVKLDITPKARASASADQFVLGPNETRTYEVALARTVEDWIKIAKVPDDETAAALNARPESVSIKIKHSGPRDSDVDEEHEIKIFGSLLDEDQEANNSWWPISELFTNDLDAVVMPGKRTYWKSRSAQSKYEVGEHAAD